MENASKALIIAGAILISILLISVGIMVMNSAGSATDEVGSTADSMARQQFNSQFTAYEGKDKSANDVKQLIALIRSNNGAQGNGSVKIDLLPEGETLPGATSKTTRKEKSVYLKSGKFISSSDGKEKTCITSTAKLSSTKTYTVEITGYSKNGYIQEIAIY